MQRSTLRSTQRRAALRRARTAGLALRDRARRSDPMVVAAALTCYAVLGSVPLLAIGLRVAAWCDGTGAVVAAARDVARFLPGPLHLDRQIVEFAQSAAHTPGWTLLIALVPVSLYAEGTVRCLERFSHAREERSRTLRGRLLTPVLVVAATLAVVGTVGLLRPLLSDPFGRGLGPRLLGIFVAFLILFAAAFVVLLVVYRLFATTRLRLVPLAAAAFAAGSWMAGQTLGYVWALRLVGGFDNAFGRYAPAGEVAALVFLLYLQQLVLVLGYLLALTLHEEDVWSGGPPRRPAVLSRPSSGR